MKQILINIYQASELTPEALERAKNEMLQEWAYPWYDEGKKILQIIENALNFSYFRWSVDDCEWSYHFTMPEEISELTGQKAA